MARQQGSRNNVKKKKSDYSKFIVIFIIVANIIFTYAVLKIFLVTGTEPQFIVSAWFSFTTVELWSLAGIKKKKEETKQKEIRYTDTVDKNNFDVG